jgi:hypothetical protein
VSNTKKNSDKQGKKILNSISFRNYSQNKTTILIVSAKTKLSTGARSASFPMVTGDSFSGGKVAEA